MTNKKTEQKFHHEAKLLNIDDVIKNEWNPNVMDDRIYEQTVKNIREEGFVYPILVRSPEKGKYMIIDGEHRWKAAKELGYTQIPAIILDKNMPDAMVATINFNKLRGEFDTLKLAEVIHTLMKEFTIEELEEKLGYTESELTGLDSLREFDFDQYDKGEAPEGEELTSEEQKFELILTSKQMKIVETALNATEKEDQAEALVVICLHFLKTTKKHAEPKR